MGSSQTRARTLVPCIGRRILNRCATREVPTVSFLCRDSLLGLSQSSACAIKAHIGSRFCASTQFVSLCQDALPSVFHLSEFHWFTRPRWSPISSKNPSMIPPILINLHFHDTLTVFVSQNLALDYVVFSKRTVSASPSLSLERKKKRVPPDTGWIRKRLVRCFGSDVPPGQSCSHRNEGSRRRARQAPKIKQQLRRGITSHCSKVWPSIHTSAAASCKGLPTRERSSSTENQLLQFEVSALRILDSSEIPIPCPVHRF